MSHPEANQLNLEVQKQTSSGNGKVKKEKKLSIPRCFSKSGVHPYDEIEWHLSTASIINDKNEVVFEKKDIEVPKNWSQTALNIVASKYFHTHKKSQKAETIIKQLIERVTEAI